MTTQQPEALRLADNLEANRCHQAARELRRLHAENEALNQKIAAAQQGLDALPMQPVALAADGCIRFRENRIVSALLDRSSEHGREYGYTLNDVVIDFAKGRYTNEELMQLYQLVGYSVSGYGDLSHVSRESASKADAVAEALAAQAKPGE